MGLSEPTLSMIFDNLESCNLFPTIQIINNLRIKAFKAFRNQRFEIEVVDELHHRLLTGKLFLGVNKPMAKFAVQQAFADMVDEKSHHYINIVHNTSALSSTATFGHGVHINSLVSVAAHSHIGNFVSINRNASIGHHTQLGSFVTVNPGAHVAGFVEIGEKTLIGMGANIGDGVRIGKNAIIGAGTLVRKDIPDNVMAFGNPCKIVKKNETQSL